MENAVIQEMVAKATDKELKALLNTPFAPFAQTELDFRIANAEELQKAQVAQATATLEGFGFDVTDVASLANAFVRIKGGALAWYELEAENIPAPLANLRNALFVVATSQGMPAEASARKAWLAEITA